MHELTEAKWVEEALAERTRALALSADIGRALTSGNTLREMLQGCAEAMVNHFDAAFARVWTLDAAGRALELQASAGLYTHLDGPHSRVPVGQFKIGLIAQERKPHLTNTVASDPRVSNQEWARREQMVAFAGYPLMVDGRLMGVTAMFARQPLSQAVLDTLATVSDQIALGIARKRAEAELASSREWFSTTLSSIGDAVIATDPYGNVTFMNPVATVMTGCREEAALGRPLTEVFRIVNEQTHQAVANPVDKVLQEGQVVGLANHTVLIARDGSRRSIDDSAAPIRGANGELIGVVLVFHDVTERRQAEKEQQRLANYNHLLLQSTGEGIYGVDLEGKCTFLNSAGARMLGVDVEDVIGKNMHAITHHSHADGSPYSQQECPIFRAFTTGVSCRVDDEVFFRADGAAFAVEYSSFPIVDDGMIHGAVVTFTNINARKRTQDALQASEARYQRIAANVPGMVYQFVLHTDGSVDFPFVSEYSRELYGLEPEFIKANPMHLIEIIHPEDRALFNASVLDSANSLRSWKWSGRFLHSTGEYRWIEGASRPQKEANGDILWDGLLIDITNRKHAEAELLQAKEVAEAATLAKSQFLATMSHEIRTPMNAVIGMTGLLLDTPLTQQQQEYAQIIRDSGDALLTVINDILDFSKIEAGQMEVERQPFDLRDCIEAALDLVAVRAAERGLDLAYVMSPDTPPAVIGDVTRVRQILVNLFSNAIKFTEQGEVILSVSSSPLESGEYELRFTVRDTGIGIPPERMDRLFRSFSQVDASTTRRYGGTGLGLVISKRLCEMMGGRIWAESTVGVGSTFYVALPMAVSPDAIHTPIEPDEAILEGRRLLIVDDNATNRQILSLQAENWGMETCACATAQEALDRLHRGERFDLAILDIQMPDMDGITLAEEMHRCCGDLPIPLIGLSSVWPKRSDVADAGFTEMLTKPIKQSQLYDVLATVLSGIRQASRVMGSTSASAPPIFDTDLGKRMPLRILIAEDLSVNQKLLQALLAKFSYRADVAGNGVEVLQGLQRQEYDVILMDIQMPEMDGLEASRRINRRYGVKRPRIVALTANAMKEDRDICIAAGMDDYLAKPVKPEALRQALVRCGEWRQSHAVEESKGRGKAREADVRPPEVGELPSASAPAAVEAPVDLPPVEQVIAPAFLKEIRSMRDILPELIETFCSDVRPRIDLMRVSVANRDPSTLARAAHGVRGSAGSMGGSRLAALCNELEQKGRAGTVDGTAPLFPEIEIEYEKLCTALKRVMEEDPEIE